MVGKRVEVKANVLILCFWEGIDRQSLKKGKLKVTFKKITTIAKNAALLYQKCP